eukprot:GHRR01024496.1.p1 GENE.GHRR01024496.1~~GHRR01024496.1.p1  ORF type:complete len:304 (+),score=106.79 GHRR01024496.1:607-1518(+)
MRLLKDMRLTQLNQQMHIATKVVNAIAQQPLRCCLVQAMAHPEDSYHPSSVNGAYDSAFPNVGLVVWQSGFVLGDYLLRTKPLGSWAGLKVLELGCGTGQLGIVLALAGADVTLTDLPHITPLTRVNVDLNAARCHIHPKVAPYMWGTPTAAIPKQAGVANEQLQQQHWDAIVAADVLYEPQHYDKLLASLDELCSAALFNTAARAAHQMGSNQTDQRQPQPQQQQQESTCSGDNVQCNSSLQGVQSQLPPVYICYRVRCYGEHRFEAKAAKQGFGVSAVPLEELHPDYNCGGYRLICLTRQQ